MAPDRPISQRLTMRYPADVHDVRPTNHGTYARKNWGPTTGALVQGETAVVLVVHGPVTALAWSNRPWLQVITTLLPARAMPSVGDVATS